MQKHAITIKGHRTSISLEPEFWLAIKTIAAEQKRPLAQLISDIDTMRGREGLCSAIRVFVLNYFLTTKS